ncbi:MAG: hypothetical protein AAF600_05190 [Bacteroidota bacterium]
MDNELLRHILSTVNYRFEKSIAGSHTDFGDFSLGHDSRSPKELVNHMFAVIHYTRVFIEQEKMPDEEIEDLSFNKEVARFKNELIKVDQLLATKPFDINYSKKLVQGPFSDVLTHIGQIAMLQRLVENPIPWEDYSKSDLQTGLTDEKAGENE